MGERLPVYAVSRGEKSPSLQGHVIIEDLSGVLGRINARSGANGPQSEVTQWILAQAARHFAAQLTEDAEPVNGEGSLPKALSVLVGHEPFMKNALGLSVHQMLRRWPQASDWYDDLLAYILRPNVMQGTQSQAVVDLPRWFGLPFGELLAEFTDQQVNTPDHGGLYQLRDIVDAMWPNHPQVQAARVRHMQSQVELWTPLAQSVLDWYGLRLRAGVRIHVIIWAVEALASWQIRTVRITKGRPPMAASDSPLPGGSVADAALLLVAGAVEDLSGRMLTVAELTKRRPRPLST